LTTAANVPSQFPPQTDPEARTGVMDIAVMAQLRTAYSRTQLEANGITFDAACENPFYAVALINIAAEINRGRR
jgi:hypothetical protein